jgi:phosphate transport system permease protein
MMPETSTTYNMKMIKLTADKNRPLALTPLQDMRGFLFLHLGRFFLFLVTCTSVMMVLLIFFFVIQQAMPFFGKLSLADMLKSKSWYPTASPPQFGILSLIAGSLYVTIAAIVLAVPTSILAAVFLSEVVSFKVRDFVKPVIEVLAAIPSVAYGFFAVLVLAPWMQTKLGFTTGTNALNASIVLSIMALPTIISVTEDSITAVGHELREASYGLGATRCETVIKVIVPAAHSGIIAAVVLGMMRAIGETMVVWMASGNAARIPSPWWDLSQSIRTMTATIAGEMGETPQDTAHYWALFVLGVVLLVMTFLLNIVSEYFLAAAKKKTGKS